MPRILISIAGKKPQPYRFPLDRPLTTLGRATDNDIVIDDSSISAHHAEMRRVPGGMVLNDMGSTNGIKLAGRSMLSIDLVPDINVRLGDVEFLAEFTDEELEELSTEDHVPQQKAAPDSKPTGKPKSAKPLVKLLADDEEDQPASGKREASSETDDSSSKLVGMLSVVILAVLAFLIGLTIRHFAKTGEFLPAQFFAG